MKKIICFIFLITCLASATSFAAVSKGEYTAEFVISNSLNAYINGNSTPIGLDYTTYVGDASTVSCIYGSFVNSIINSNDAYELTNVNAYLNKTISFPLPV